MFFSCCPSPIGIIKILANDVGITALWFVEPENAEIEVNTSLVIEQCIVELEEYFLGKRRFFTVPIDFDQATQFQKTVFGELEKIAYAHTISYETLAVRLGSKRHIRASASANGKNPIAILVPCHRVVGKSGKLVGYSGGIWRKQFLLSLEQQNAGQALVLF